MSDYNPEAHALFHTAEISFNEISDALHLARTNIDEAMRHEKALETVERHRLNTMSRTLRTMQAQFRNVR